MKKYPENSAQALWRLMSIMVCADNEIAAEEGKELEWIAKFVEDMFGNDIPHDQKNTIINKTIDEWNAIGGGDAEGYIIEAAKEINNREKQEFTLGVIINIAKADDNFHHSELAMVRILRGEWGFSEGEMENIIDKKPPSKKDAEELLGEVATEV